MNTFKFILLIVSGLIQSTFSFCQNNPDDFPVLKGPYLGQTLPGKVPVRFAPDLIEGEAHESPSFFPDGKEFVINVMGGATQLMYFTMTGETWSLQTPPFEMPKYLNGIFISPDGQKLYMLVYENNRENFWIINKNGNEWMKPKSLGPEVNSLNTHWSFSVAANQNLYCGAEGSLYVFRYDGEKHSGPEKLPSPVNGSGRAITPYIAPDESYILFSRDETAGVATTGLPFNDLYISYRLTTKSWSDPVNVGTGINTPNTYEMCPMVSPDGKYFFFIRKNPGHDFQIYWVKADFIIKLKPKRFATGIVSIDHGTISSSPDGT